MKGLVGLTTFVFTAHLVSGSQRASNDLSTSSKDVPAPQQLSNRSNGSDFVIPDLFNIGSWDLFLGSQVTPASVDDILPTGPLLPLYAGTTKYRLKVCNRAAVTDCMPTGTSQTWTIESAGCGAHIARCNHQKLSK
jgi:hypothetical protein